MPLFMVKKHPFNSYRFDKRYPEVGDIATIWCGRNISIRRITKIRRGSLARILFRTKKKCYLIIAFAKCSMGIGFSGSCFLWICSSYIQAYQKLRLTHSWNNQLNFLQLRFCLFLFIQLSKKCSDTYIIMIFQNRTRWWLREHIGSIQTNLCGNNINRGKSARKSPPDV